MDPLNEVQMSPRIVRSVTKALNLDGVESGVANTASNTNATVSRLNEIKTQNAQIISLLQQLVDK